MVEKEYKILLTKEQYKALNNYFSWTDEFVQINHYFNDIDEYIYNNDITLRIREKKIVFFYKLRSG